MKRKAHNLYLSQSRTHKQLTSGSSYFCIYTFTRLCYTHTHTHRRGDGGVLFLCRGIKWVQGRSTPTVAALPGVCCGLCINFSEGKRLQCTQIITAHQPLPLSHLFTQQLGLAELWLHRQTRTHTHTHFQIHTSLYSRTVGESSERRRCLAKRCALPPLRLLLFVRRSNTSRRAHSIHRDFKALFPQLIRVRPVRRCGGWRVRLDKQESVASAPRPSSSSVNYLWLLYHVSYTVCGILNT